MDRIKRRQALAILSKEQLVKITKDYFIDSRWGNAEHLRIAILDAWCANDDTSIHVDVSEMIREAIR